MATERDNYVQLVLAGINIKSFEVKEHSITDNQPYSGVSVSSSDTLNIKAGRHASDKVAIWFKEKLASGVVVGCDKSDTYPKELNFALYGTLTFESAGKIHTINDILLAQGHGDRNNWWLGGPKMEGGSVKPLIGAAVATAYIDRLAISKVAFFAPIGCVSHFDLMTLDA